MLFFFFSSRRRHTRLQGDWSSDVCSSDLCAASSRPAFTSAMSLDRSRARTVARFLRLGGSAAGAASRSEEHTSELQSPCNLVCRLLLEKNKSTLRVSPTYCARSHALHHSS